MSAFIVNDAHIHAIIKAGLSLDANSARLRWYASAEKGEEWRSLTNDTADAVGQMLLLENARSVTHRYQEPLELPHYTYNSRAPLLEPVQILKALFCLDYQSCEHPGWQTSGARAFCEALRDSLIRTLPGYEEADWEIAPKAVLSR